MLKKKKGKRKLRRSSVEGYEDTFYVKKHMTKDFPILNKNFSMNEYFSDLISLEEMVVS